MRRILVIALAGLTAALAAVPGAHAAGETEQQSVAGNIKMFTRFTDAEGGFPGAGRRRWNAAHETNGLVSYTFPVDRETWMGRFELTVTGESGVGDPADLGIYFYEDLADAGNSPATSTAEYDVRRAGGETGFVAPGSRFAIVFMSRGINVDFAYRGFTPMTVDVNEAGFSPAEVTVGNGGWIVWKNVGSDFHGVRATNGSFNSSPNPKQPITPGGTYAVQFLAEGDVAYADPFSSTGAGGVVHVVPGPGPGTPEA